MPARRHLHHRPRGRTTDVQHPRPQAAIHFPLNKFPARRTGDEQEVFWFHGLIFATETRGARFNKPKLKLPRSCADLTTSSTLVGLRCRAAQISGRRGSDRPTRSIYEDEDGGILGGFHYILKLLILRIRFLEFCVHLRHGLEKAQEQTAL